MNRFELNLSEFHLNEGNIDRSSFFFFKLTNNLSSLNKENLYFDGVRIDPILARANFYDFISPVSS